MKKFNDFKIHNKYLKLVEKVQTIFKDKIKEDTFKSKAQLSEDEIVFKILGQQVERSYEDRSVYMNINYKNDIDITTWLNGEDAIKLGQILIKHGLYALESNMINHQKIHHYSRLFKFLSDGRIDKVILTKIDKKSDEYKGTHLFKIKPVWKKDKAPKYELDFDFEDYIHISPFDKEFKKQFKDFGGFKKVKFINFDYDEEVKNFNKELKKFN